MVLLLSFSRPLAMKCASMPGFFKQMTIVLVLLSFARLLAMKCASMPGFIKQMFIVLVLMLFLGRLLAMKCASMTGFIEQMFIVLVLMLFFGRSLAMKCASINDQQCLIRPLVIDLNLDALYYYLFSINMKRYDGRCVEDLFDRTFVRSKT